MAPRSCCRISGLSGFNWLVGIKISDTQTGLRGIPKCCIEKFIEIPGERYEYETNMLLQCKKADIRITEQSIKTVYLENNNSSSFRPVIDSIKIYSLLFKFIITAVFTKGRQAGNSAP